MRGARDRPHGRRPPDQPGPTAAETFGLEPRPSANRLGLPLSVGGATGCLLGAFHPGFEATPAASFGAVTGDELAVLVGLLGAVLAWRFYGWTTGSTGSSASDSSALAEDGRPGTERGPMETSRESSDRDAWPEYEPADQVAYLEDVLPDRSPEIEEYVSANVRNVPPPEEYSEDYPPDLPPVEYFRKLVVFVTGDPFAFERDE